MTDFERYLGEYGKPLAPILEKHGAEVLAATPEPQILEGAYDRNFTVVIKFPSAEAVQRWHASPEYQPLKDKRGGLTNPDNSVMLVASAFAGLPG